MLLASEKGAGLIVSVGAHFNLVEFLDKARGGMSSTFLTRLRVGELLVDAKGVAGSTTPASAAARWRFCSVPCSSSWRSWWQRPRRSVIWWT